MRALGYDGGYDAIRRYARSWAKANASAAADAFAPLTFAPGEAYQFDWSHEIVVMDGVTTIVKVAHLRLCHSRMMLVRAPIRARRKKMVFDAHERGVRILQGRLCVRGVYDNMKTAVETIFAGKDRQYNRRFLQLCSHHLVEPVACTPASGWEKGQVENQVGLVRERFFTPRLRVKSYDELNAWLMDKCIAWAKAHGHPERPDQMIWEVFEEERPKLIPYRGRFDGFHALPASVSKTCLVRFDNNKYSVSASAVGRPVDIHAYAERVVIRQDGRIVAEHPRRYGRGATVYDPRISCPGDVASRVGAGISAMFEGIPELGDELTTCPEVNGGSANRLSFVAATTGFINIRLYLYWLQLEIICRVPRSTVSAFVRSLTWTQETAPVQFIRTSAHVLLHMC